MTWYKELRSKEWRRAMYSALRSAGLPRTLAQRVRDWSEPHIKTFLSSNAHLLNKPPEQVWADFEEELITEVSKCRS